MDHALRHSPVRSNRAGALWPAFEVALSEQRAEIERIAREAAAPSFDNTLAALERSGWALKRVGGVFFNLSSADTNDALQAIEREMAPVLAKHRNAIFMNEALFRRVDAILPNACRPRPHQSKPACSIAITPSSRGQARLEPEAKARVAAITERLATLGTQFSQNVLADEKAYALVLEGEPDLAGLPCVPGGRRPPGRPTNGGSQASTPSRSRDPASSRSSPSRAGAT